MENQSNSSVLESYFYIYIQKSLPEGFLVEGKNMHNATKMKELLLKTKNSLKAYDLDLPAAFIGLTLFNICVCMQYYFSKFNCAAELSPDQINMLLNDSNETNGFPHISFHLDEIKLTSLSITDRDENLVAELTRYYEAFTPLIEFIAVEAGVKPVLIWKQFGSRMTTYIDMLMALEVDTKTKQRYEHDYNLLMSLPASLFHLQKNPFIHKPRYVEYPPTNQKMMIRSACCLYNKREGGQKCFNCPRLKHEEREQIKKQLIEAQQ